MTVACAISANNAVLSGRALRHSHFDATEVDIKWIPSKDIAVDLLSRMQRIVGARLMVYVAGFLI